MLNAPLLTEKKLLVVCRVCGNGISPIVIVKHQNAIRVYVSSGQGHVVYRGDQIHAQEYTEGGGMRVAAECTWNSHRYMSSGMDDCEL